MPHQHGDHASDLAYIKAYNLVIGFHLDKYSLEGDVASPFLPRIRDTDLLFCWLLGKEEADQGKNDSRTLSDSKASNSVKVVSQVAKQALQILRAERCSRQSNKTGMLSCRLEFCFAYPHLRWLQVSIWVYPIYNALNDTTLHART